MCNLTSSSQTKRLWLSSHFSQYSISVPLICLTLFVLGTAQSFWAEFVAFLFWLSTLLVHIFSPFFPLTHTQTKDLFPLPLIAVSFFVKPSDWKITALWSL